MNKADDHKLVKGCIEGDADAWNEFVDRFSGLIYWAIKRKLHKYNCAYLVSEVEDIYQRLFASIWEKRSLINVSERDNISPWLVVLASNFTIDFIRRKFFEQSYLRNALEVETKTQELPILLNDDKRLLNKAISSLSEKEKTYLELSYMSGKIHKEIAEIFNVPINSVSTTISRAKNKIKKYIESKNKKV